MNHGSALCAATRLGYFSTATRPSGHLKAGSKPWRTRAISAASSAGIDWIKRNVARDIRLQVVEVHHERTHSKARLTPGLPARRRARDVHPPRGRRAFIADVRGDDSEIAAKLRIEERELEAGGLN